ncbi:23S rRNA (pseudouridine(1915)-N(3))-methyltransferase RlmH, partial [Escherichia coli]
MGKTQEPYLREGILEYEKRLVHYVRFKRLELSDIKNTSSLSCDQIKEKEGILLLKNIKISDHLVLFDE